MVKVIGVKFRTAGKVYYFDPVEFVLNVGDHVIVERQHVVLNTEALLSQIQKWMNQK